MPSLLTVFLSLPFNELPWLLTCFYVLCFEIRFQFQNPSDPKIRASYSIQCLAKTYILFTYRSHSVEIVLEKSNRWEKYNEMLIQHKKSINVSLYEGIWFYVMHVKLLNYQVCLLKMKLDGSRQHFESWCLFCFSLSLDLQVTSDAGYFVPNIYFYCELWLYYRFFGKFLFHSANSSCQKLYNEI